MAGHFHLCEQCGEQYVCTAELESNYDGWPDPVCVAQKESDPSFQMCVDCAEKAMSSTYAPEYYDDLRAQDEQHAHVAANSSLGKDIAKSVRTKRKVR